MTDIANSDLTYTFLTRDRQFLGRQGYRAYGSIAGGNGSLTWPATGLALDKGKMGFKVIIRSLNVIETNLKGYKFEWDVSAQKLALCGASAESGTISATSAGTPAGTVSAPTGNLTSKTLTMEAATGNVTALGLTIAAPTINITNSGADADANASIMANATGFYHNVANVVVNGGISAPTGNISNGHVTLQAATGNVANSHLTIAAPTFAGNALATHTHTFTGSVSIGSISSAAPAAFVLQVECIGY
jgi:hypothetical protein